MKSFTSQYDEMYYAAKGILEGNYNTESIQDKVSKLKVGDKTNLGVVTQIDNNAVYFKPKNLPVTKIHFDQRKMGNNDFVLDNLTVIESVELEETSMPKEIIDYANSIGVDNDVTAVIFNGMKTVYDKVKLGQAEQIILVQNALDAYKKTKRKNESVELEEAFRPGADMVSAPIGPDTVTAKGLKKLWGIKMRAGKWADTFVGLFDLPDGKPYGIINDKGTTRYASVNDFNAAFKKLTL